MKINLEKGSRINLEKADGGALTKIKMGLGWDPAGRDSIDLDASCIMLDENKSMVDQVSFRQLKSKCGNVKHSGDNLTGEGNGDDEVIELNLQGIKETVKHLVFTVNSFLGQTFDQVANASCRIYDDKGVVVTEYKLTEKGAHTGLIMVSVYRHNGAWKVKALGHPTSGRMATDMLADIAAVV
jgi:tellurium resistance protein TerZ